MRIRQENSGDFQAVSEVIRRAFLKEAHSDHTEHLLVERLRKSAGFIAAFSLVSKTNRLIVGHILLTSINIQGQNENYESLALAPLSILPEYQRQGIGKSLMITSHEIAREQGFSSIMVVGHHEYYTKFGYKPAHHFGITFPFDVPKENCLAIELVVNALSEVAGVVQYPSEFYS